MLIEWWCVVSSDTWTPRLYRDGLVANMIYMTTGCFYNSVFFFKCGTAHWHNAKLEDGTVGVYWLPMLLLQDCDTWPESFLKRFLESILHSSFPSCLIPFGFQGALVSEFDQLLCCNRLCFCPAICCFLELKFAAYTAGKCCHVHYIFNPLLGLPNAIYLMLAYNCRRLAHLRENPKEKVVSLSPAQVLKTKTRQQFWRNITGDTRGENKKGLEIEVNEKI